MMLVMVGFCPWQSFAIALTSFKQEGDRTWLYGKTELVAAESIAGREGQEPAWRTLSGPHWVAEGGDRMAAVKGGNWALLKCV